MFHISIVLYIQSCVQNTHVDPYLLLVSTWEELCNQHIDHPTEGLVSIVRQEVVLERTILPFYPVVCVELDMKTFPSKSLYPTLQKTKSK